MIRFEGFKKLLLIILKHLRFIIVRCKPEKVWLTSIIS